jgi:hypothetical protein
MSEKKDYYGSEEKAVKPPKVTTTTVTPAAFPRIDPRTGQPVQYQEVADTTSTTPASEKALATSAETHVRFLGDSLKRILAVHSGMESSINPDHEYWHLKEVYTSLVPPPVVP